MSFRTIVIRMVFWQWLAAIGALLSMGLAAPAQAAVQEIHLIAAGVNPSSDKATAAALDYARKRAVYLLLAKMKIERADERAAALTPVQMGRIVRGVNVTQMKRSGDVTYAEVTVSIVDRILLQELGIDPSGDTGDVNASYRGVLVLPVLVVKGQPYVWGKENTLLAPMASEVLRLSHGAVVVPTGDFDDLRLIDNRNVLTMKGADLSPMFTRYGVEEIIVAMMPDDAPDAEGLTTILLRRLTPETERVEQIALQPLGKTPPERMQEAVSLVATSVTQMAASTSQKQQEKLKAAPQVPVYLRYGSVREIGQIQTAIRSTEGVMQLSIPAIDLQQMQGVIYLSADKEVVKKALAKKGLLVRDQKAGWLVSLR